MLPDHPCCFACSSASSPCRTVCFTEPAYIAEEIFSSVFIYGQLHSVNCKYVKSNKSRTKLCPSDDMTRDEPLVDTVDEPPAMEQLLCDRLEGMFRSWRMTSSLRHLLLSACCTSQPSEELNAHEEKDIYTYFVTLRV